ncbi:LysR family transcriptional regulator [Granulosicoccus sp. 3-233]|uniref:LysR family transcriptional regulator n=1 Tax=Granulosicoccus sp. 3-233 TaxID=3417969 RepID=UPI003D32781F
MEIRVLKTFVAVARLQGFSAAARALNTVQPAVSRQISDLEAELGVSLFRRSTREVHITAAGDMLLKEAEQIIAHEERARQQVQRAGQGQIGRLRVGFLGSACQSFLPRLILRYSEAFPEVQVSLLEMRAFEQTQALSEGRLDISLSRGLSPSAPDSITSLDLYTDQLMAFVPLNHALASRASISLDELADERFVLYNRSGSATLFDQTISACHKAGFSPEIIQQANTMQAVLTSVASCLGVAIAPACIRKLDMTGCGSLRLQDRTVSIPFQMHFQSPGTEATTSAFIDLVKAARKQIRQEMNPSRTLSRG